VKYGVKTYGMSEPFHREVTKSLLQRSEAAGFEAIVVTLDAQNFGKKRDTMREPFKIPANLRHALFFEQIRIVF
jgi:isopentenyl diphosphate isomerase/L-lactate dehydrogenase-like FMN-dependent dehydrogenase